MHIGITEAGLPWAGTIRSAVGIGILLFEGLADTIRVSLTGDPLEEVRVAYEILRALDLRRRGPTIISCPTCGRTEVDLVRLAGEVEHRLGGVKEPITVAVMGCVVNGPGEARLADYGIAGGKAKGALFRHGEVLRTVPEEELVDALMAEITRDLGLDNPLDDR
jgi:(E)-4-hydroxy-3-methylbut-2-enyl-diphosphate synthase